MPAALQRARRDSSRLPILALALSLMAAPAAADRVHEVTPRPLTVAIPGSALQDTLQKAFFGPFTAQTHVGIRAVAWDGTLPTLQQRARSGADVADLVLMDDSSVLVACRQGLLLPLGAEAGPAGNAPDATGRCGRDALRTTLVLAWDRSRIDAAPGWAEFWDVARRPGRRGLERGPRGTLEIALLADGVPADEIYAALGSPEGVDRAFRKLDQLKPYIVWWTNPADATRIMQAGAVLMTSAPSNVVLVADLAGHRDFAAQWQQSISTLLSWAVPGRPPAERSPSNASSGDRVARAGALLAFMADPARQAAFATLDSAAGPIGALPPGSPASADDGAATPQHLHEALRQDDAFWAGRLEALQARFDAWISRPAGTKPGP